MDAAGADAAERPLRRRDAVATRRALLAAARRQLAENGFAGTTTRDVAAAAGVNQALVYRYFGSKEKLLAEAAGGDSVDTLQSVISRAPLAELPHVLLDYALDMHAAAGERTSSLATLVSGVDDAGLVVLIRERIESGFVDLLAQRLDGPDAVVRAELLAALVTGTILLREKVKTQALAKADRQTLRTWIDVMAAPLLTAPAEPTPTPGATDG